MPRHSRLYDSCCTGTSRCHRLRLVDTACLGSITFVVHALYREFAYAQYNLKRSSLCRGLVEHTYMESTVNHSGQAVFHVLWPICRYCGTSVSPGQILRLPRFSLDERTHTRQGEGASGTRLWLLFWQEGRGQHGCKQLIIGCSFYTRQHCNIVISKLAMVVVAIYFGQQRLSTFASSAE